MSTQEVTERFLGLVADAGLPAPDEIWEEGESIAFRWSENQLVVWVDPDRDDMAPIDEFEAALMRGLAPDDWPFPTAEGYRDYIPDP